MIEVKRIELWRGPFEEAIDAMRREPFSWNGNDCAVGLASRLTKALTGVDLAEEHRGRYTTELEALAYLSSLGFDDLADAAATFLPEIAVAETRIGDIVAIPVDAPFKHALGVVNGERVFVLNERGMATVGLLKATRAFKVG